MLSHIRQSLQENGLIKVEYPLSADQALYQAKAGGRNRVLLYRADDSNNTST